MSIIEKPRRLEVGATESIFSIPPYAGRTTVRATQGLLAMWLAVTAIVVLSGCAASRSVKNLLDPVARAGALSSAPGSVRFSARIIGLADGLPLFSSETGIADFTDPHRAIGEQVVELAGQTRRYRILQDGDSDYLAYAAPAGRAISPQRRWSKQDLAQLYARLGVGDQAEVVAHEASLFGPFAALQFLAHFGLAKRIGAAIINGAPVTHYRVTIDLRRAATGGPAWFREAAAYAVSQGESSEQLDIWIDHHGLVRRETLPFRAAANDLLDQPAYDAHETIDFLSYGKPVPITLPPAHAVVDITQRLIAGYDARLVADRQLQAALSGPQRSLRLSESSVTFKYPPTFHVHDATHGPSAEPAGHIALSLSDPDGGTIQLDIYNDYHGQPALASVRASVGAFDSTVRAAVGAPVHGVVETHGGLATIDYRDTPRRRATDWFRTAYVFVGTRLYVIGCYAST